MFNLIIILLSTINGEPKDSNNYKIAKYILENIRNLENYQLTDLAKKCYVSNSSISRFCKDIGLQDFNELKYQIAKYSVESKNIKSKFNYLTNDGSNIFDSYISSVISNLEQLKSKNIDSSINELVDDIYKFKKVAAFGYMQSENVALNLQFDLQSSGKIIYTCYKVIDQQQYITTSNDENLIIIFSESGSYFNRIFPRVKPFRDSYKKPKIWLVTSNKDIHISFVDKYIRYNSRGDFASHPYPLVIISDLISMKYAQKENT